MKRLWFELRCLLAEMLVGWAYDVAPDGYVISATQASVDSYVRGQKDAQRA